MEKKGKVLVAMSGGVDSSVSAALLLEQGYKVEGAFIVTWQPPWLPCTWREERRDAMRVAARLRIPIHTVDLSSEYEHDVVDYLIDEYKKGRTPNPDVMCNKHIKFGGLFAWAMEHGFDFLATGHYARIDKDATQDTALLKTSIDRNKDQSYFLWTLSQEHLMHTLFPVGGIEKKDVRELARHYGLPTADKKDSQGICFLGKIHMREFLAHYIPHKTGDVLDEAGRVIGTHDGALFLTLGQRHGFTVPARTPIQEPLYVVDKDVLHNTITVAPNDSPAVLDDVSRVVLRDVNWISGHVPMAEHGNALVFQARLRYRQKLFEVTVDEATSTSAVVTPRSVQRYIPAGQSMVIYEADVCLGGGIITA